MFTFKQKTIDALITWDDDLLQQHNQSNESPPMSCVCTMTFFTSQGESILVMSDQQVTLQVTPVNLAMFIENVCTIFFDDAAIAESAMADPINALRKCESPEGLTELRREAVEQYCDEINEEMWRLNSDELDTIDELVRQFLQ